MRDLDGALLDELTTLARRAGAAILKVREGSLASRAKSDGSPVTAADEASQGVILEGLARLLPGVPLVSEEAVPKQAPGRDFVLIDPLDGTKELIAGRDEFTVNIAIVRSGDPVLGVVTAPALDMIWRGIVGHGADRISGDGVPVPIHTRPRPQRLTVAVSRTHPDAATEALLARLPVGHRIACGSALKFCRVAEGEADFYPRLAPTSEWDLAAGHAVLVAAGGVVVTPDGAPLRYGHVGNEFLVPGFMAWGSLT